MIYVFIGNEINIINKNQEELIKELNISNIIKLDYTDLSIMDVINESCFVDLFNERKLIIVSNFSFKKMKEKDEEEFMRYIENMNDNVIIFKCIDESLDNRKKLIKLINEKCKVVNCEKLDYKSLNTYITNMFKEKGYNINNNQIYKIMTLCEYNTDLTINEVTKLMLYKGNDTQITNADIDAVISRSYEKEMYNFIDNVMRRSLSKSFDSYNLLKGSVDEIVILDSLAKEIRQVYQIKELTGKMNDGGIMSVTGIRSSFSLQKKKEYINLFTVDELLNGLYLLSNADIDVKINGIDKSKVLESFLINFCNK